MRGTAARRELGQVAAARWALLVVLLPCLVALASAVPAAGQRAGPTEGATGGGWGGAVSRSQPIQQGKARQSSQQAQQPQRNRSSAGSQRGSGRQSNTVARAVAFRLKGDGQRTRVEIVVTRPVVAGMFVLGNPYRAVIDVPNLDFRLPASAGKTGHGLVTAYRYGQFEAGRSRIVIDAAGPIRIENGAFRPPVAKAAGLLSFDLVRIPQVEFDRLTAGQPAGGAGAAAGASAIRPTHADAMPSQGVPAGLAAGGPAGEAASGPVIASGRAGGPGRRGRRLPVVVIDPGHGGIDPGTVSATNLTEKSVVLAVALQLRDQLARSRLYEVRMTRDKDVFVSLKNRVELSRQAGAKLFISIHADALAERDQAASVRGASIYTLSDKASDAVALKLAEKENAVDVLAGMETVPASDEDQVRSILIDLVRRETSNFSAMMRRLLVRNMKGSVPLAKEPERSAAFTVLKQADTPSVLIELGYMSNAQDLARLSRADWQKRAAASIATAVDAYFARDKTQVAR